MHRILASTFSAGLLGLLLLTTPGCPLGTADPVPDLPDNPFTPIAAGPSCDSCQWAYDICLEQARDMTIDDMRERRCDNLLVCFAWYDARRFACEQSYVSCLKGCTP